MTKKTTFSNTDIASAVDAFTANCTTVTRVMPGTSKHGVITELVLPGTTPREYTPKLIPEKDYNGPDEKYSN
jgi:hypothetical protein